MNARFDLSNRVVIVTGGGKGIGKAYSEEMARAGARVVAADIDGDAAEAVAQQIRDRGNEAIGIRVDISNPESCEAMASTVLDQYGVIHGLVNNAALMSTLARRSWFDIPVEEWDSVMAVNLRGLFLCCKAVFPTMRKRGYGKIVNISSSRIWEGNPNRLHYTTSKMGVVGFTRAIAREVGEYGITVNSVTPGFTLSETQLQSSDASYVNQRSYAEQAIKRPQVPEDLVGAVMFFLSAASDFISGQTLNVDGGKAMH
jgi:3-oxoacyl-[acyl-carrier protein] reductase